MTPKTREENFLALIAQDPDAVAMTPKSRDEQYLSEIAANMIPTLTCAFTSTGGTTKCSQKFADIRAALAKGKEPVATVGQYRLRLVDVGANADGNLVWQGVVWSGTWSASTGPQTTTYYRCTLTKTNTATIESNA